MKRNYRKVYEQYHGPIPRDNNGRAMEIHHIDGNHNNNDITNLKLVTIEEHYQIHYNQGDYRAAWLISGKMTLTPQDQSNLAKLESRKRVEEGTHNWLGGTLQSAQAQQRVKEGTHHFLNKEKAKEQAIKRTKEGKNPFSGGEIQRRTNEKRINDGSHNFLDSSYQSQNALARVKNGTHPWLDKEKAKQRTLDRYARGEHPAQVQWTCEHCEKQGFGKGNYTRHHGNNCKHKKQ